ncbi:hypothetical protein ILUMI_18493, partial [Ignelater luminosus]
MAVVSQVQLFKNCLMMTIEMKLNLTGIIREARRIIKDSLAKVVLACCVLTNAARPLAEKNDNFVTAESDDENLYIDEMIGYQEQQTEETTEGRINLLRAANVQCKQAKKDTDILIITTALDAASQFSTVTVVGEDINLLVILTGLSNNASNVYLLKPGKGKTPQQMHSPRTAINKTHPQTTVRVFKDENAEPDAVAEAGLRYFEVLYGQAEEKYTSRNNLRYQKYIKAAFKTSSNLTLLSCVFSSATMVTIPKNPESCKWKKTRNGLKPVMTTLPPAPQTVDKLNEDATENPESSDVDKTDVNQVPVLDPTPVLQEPPEN